MAKASRNKGKRGELEVASVFTDAGLPANRTAALQAGGVPGFGDVTVHAFPDLFVESKRCERYELPKWEHQVWNDCPEGRVPVIAYRRSHTHWRAVVPLNWLADTLAELAKLRAERAMIPVAIVEGFDR